MWQFRQSSRTGGCAQRNGPRLSAWQLVQLALMDTAAISFSVVVPWGLWQLVQVIFPPSPSAADGMWEYRPNCIALTWWHWPHRSYWTLSSSCPRESYWSNLTILSCPFSDAGPWTEWQVTQVTSRDSWGLPLQKDLLPSRVALETDLVLVRCRQG